MSKKPTKKVSDDRKYRPANARGMGPGAEGRAMIRAAEKMLKAAEKMSDEELARRNYSKDSTAWGMMQKAGEKLAEDYKRSVGGKASTNYPSSRYAAGGMVKPMIMLDKKKPVAPATGGKSPMIMLDRKKPVAPATGPMSMLGKKKPVAPATGGKSPMIMLDRKKPVAPATGGKSPMIMRKK